MNRADKLLDWIKQRHEGQLIRHTAEPYINHLTAVAELASVIPLGYEISLCHDLFEETETTSVELLSALTGCGYTDREADLILNCTIELTDVFTKKKHPEWKKKLRKAKEAERLTTISSAAQTVKYADLIYNIGWVVRYDLKRARKYLLKKRLLLVAMTGGEPNLHLKAMRLIEDEVSKLTSNNFTDL
jgi:(p)ppGpp synthase/HD superfamily hydrolase